MVNNCIIILFLMVSAALRAQESVPDTVSGYPGTEYVFRYDEYVMGRVGFSNGFNSFRINDDADNLDFTVAPNQQVRTTLTLTYKFIEVDLGYTPEFIRFNKDDDIKGKTSYYNFGTRLYFGRVMQQLQYATAKGYYVDKDDIGTTENLLFPDFKVQRIGGSTSYIFNENFSFRSIFLQSEWQRKSAGSFVPSLTYYRTQIENGNPSKDYIYEIALAPAYFYNWSVTEKFLVSAGVHAGIGYNFTNTKYKDGTPDESVSSLMWQTQGRVAIGYNTTHFYTGANASINSFFYNNDPQVHVQDHQQFFELYIGYRFAPPKKLKEITDKAVLPKKK